MSKIPLKIILPWKNCPDYFVERLGSLINFLTCKYEINLIESKNYLGLSNNACIIFEHASGCFKAIDLSDKSDLDTMECHELIKQDKCDFVLKCQYDSSKKISKLRPFFYFEKHSAKSFSNSLEKLRSIEKKYNKIYWRGTFYKHRKKIIEPLKDLLNDNFDKCIDFRSYYKELASYHLALSLPGGGNSCHREFECFGIGTVVVAPKFKNNYYVPLEPNKHYICIEKCKNVSDAIRSRFLSIQESEINYIRENALNYYDTYIRFEKSISWIANLLEL